MGCRRVDTSSNPFDQIESGQAPASTASPVTNPFAQMDAEQGPTAGVYTPNPKVGNGPLKAKDLRLNEDGTVDITQFPVGTPMRAMVAGKTPSQYAAIQGSIAAQMGLQDARMENTDNQPSPLERIAAGISSVAQPVVNAVRAITPGQPTWSQLQAKTAENNAVYQKGYQAEYGSPDNPLGGFDWLKTGGTALALSPVAPAVAAPVKALGLGAEALGLGTTAAEGAAGTGLAGTLGNVGAAIASPGAAGAGLGLVGRTAARVGAGAVQGSALGAYLGSASGNTAQGALEGAAGGALAVPAAAAAGAVTKPIISGASSIFNGDAAAAVKGMFTGAMSKAQGVTDPIVAPAVEGVNTPAQTPEGLATQGQVQASLKANGLDLNALPQEAKDDMAAEAAKAQATGQPIDPDYLARRTNLIANGVQPTKAMLSRDYGDWTTEQDMANVNGGQAIKQATVDANSAIAKRLQQLSDRTNGGLSSDPSTQNLDTGTQINDAITKHWTDTGKAVSAAYGQVRDAVGGNTGLVPNSLNSVLDTLNDNPANHSGIAAIQNTIKRLDPDNTGSLTVDQAEGLRQSVGQLGDNSPQGNYFRQAVKSAIDNDVIQTGGDQFAPARALAAQRFNDFSGKAAKNIIGGNVAPEQLFNRLVVSNTGSVGDLNQTVNLLNRTPEGQQALAALQQRTANYIQEKSTGNDGSVLPAKLNGIIQGNGGIGLPKIQAIFGDSGFNAYKSLGQAANDALVPPVGVKSTASANPSGTAYAAARVADMAKAGGLAAAKTFIPYAAVPLELGQAALSGIRANASLRATQAAAAEATSGTLYTPSAIKNAALAQSALAAQKASAARIGLNRMLQGPLTVGAVSAANTQQQAQQP